jgi:BolA family transcriptional regulator, general stress-responsive regulator
MRGLGGGGEMRVEEQITQKLRQAFAPVALEVVNDSHRHAGHAGLPQTGESHFSIKVVSESFAGKSRVERHRMVNEVLAEELAGKVHALAISALAPEERSRPL